jgi:hypothetical protein
METIMPKPRKVSDNQRIIEKFVERKINGVDKYFYGREGKTAKQLIDQYGLEFMLWLPIPYNSKIPSLLWFLNPDGRKYLTSSFFDYKKENPDSIEQSKQVELSSEKIGEDQIVKKQPRTLKEFLNLYK